MIYCIKEHGTWVSRYNDMIYLLRAIGLPPTHLHINNTQNKTIDTNNT